MAPVAWFVTMARRNTPPAATEVEDVLGLLFTLVCVYKPVTKDGETNSDWLFESLMVLLMTVAKLSGVTSEATPLNMS
jgi:hypothetical protein